MLVLSIFCISSTVFAADSSKKADSKLSQETACLDGKCPGELAAQADNKNIVGVDKSTASENHKTFLCNDGRCPGKTEAEAGKKAIKGQDHSSTIQENRDSQCNSGKCPDDEGASTN